MRYRGTRQDVPKSHMRLSYPSPLFNLCQLLHARAFRRGRHAVLARIYTPDRLVLIVLQQFC